MGGGQIAPLMPKPGRRGRPREVDSREVINAVRYLVHSGCGWRTPLVHFGPPHAEARGCDAGKKILSRKRHIAVDTDGRLLTSSPWAAISSEEMLTPEFQSRP